MASVELDLTKLMGFRILETTDFEGLEKQQEVEVHSAKIGEKRGRKEVRPSTDLRVKAGAKLGAKLGAKIGDKAT